MTLRKKTLLLVGLTLVGLLSMAYAVATTIVSGGFARVEEQNTQRNVDRVLDAYADELARLGTTTSDWASWDDTYAFIEDDNPTYIDSNLTETTLTKLGVNLVAFVHSSGRVIYSARFGSTPAASVPASFLAHLAPNDRLLQTSNLHDGLSGVLLLPEGPL